MTGREILSTLSLDKLPPRVPFAPTIYEHAAGILHVTPSRMAKDADLIVSGQLKAYELYKHDIISVGVDIYNIEAEALGCPIVFYDDETLPATNGVLLSNPSDLKNITVPNPYKDGRMPVFLEAGRRIHERIGNEVPVNGTIVGPFTLAAILRGFEDFLMDLLFEPEFALQQLRFAMEVGLSYAGAFVEKGLGVAINESWIAPPLLSPDLFKRCVFDFEKEMIGNLKAWD